MSIYEYNLHTIYILYVKKQYQSNFISPVQIEKNPFWGILTVYRISKLKTSIMNTVKEQNLNVIKHVSYNIITK